MFSRVIKPSLVIAALLCTSTIACDSLNKAESAEGDEADDEDEDDKKKRKGKKPKRGKGNKNKGKRNKKGDTEETASSGDNCQKAAKCCIALADKANAPQSERTFCEAMKKGSKEECDGRLKLMRMKADEENVDCS